jgi:hypothetical protein
MFASTLAYCLHRPRRGGIGLLPAMYHLWSSSELPPGTWSLEDHGH